MNCTRHFACNQIQYNNCCNIEGTKLWKWYSVYYFYFIQENVKIICEIPRYSNGKLLWSFYNVVGATQFLCINKYTHANFRALFVKTNTGHKISWAYTCIYLLLQFVKWHELYTMRAHHIKLFTRVGLSLSRLDTYFIKSLNRNICRNSFDTLEKCWMSVLMSFLEHFCRQY